MVPVPGLMTEMSQSFGGILHARIIRVVVGIVRAAVSVDISVTRVALAVCVEVGLLRVGYIRTVILIVLDAV